MKKIAPYLFIPLLIILITACDDVPGKKGDTKITNAKDSLSYALGVKIGDDFQDQNIDINRIAFTNGISDGIDGEFILTDSVIGMILSKFQNEMDAQFEQEMTLVLQKNKEAGAKFLDENKSKDGVVALPGGLQYKIIKQGNGPNPLPADSVMIHYRAMFIDGETFDQSYDRGLTGIRLTNVIQGLSDGLQLMSPGAVYELYISPELGYGDQDFANIIPGGSTLIYRIELVEVVK